MARTPPLARFDPCLPASLPLEVRPLARLDEAGRVAACGATLFFPPADTPLVLALWRPGREPAFALVAGRLARAGPDAWRLEAATGPVEAAWVVHWARADALWPLARGF